MKQAVASGSETWMDALASAPGVPGKSTNGAAFDPSKLRERVKEVKSSSPPAPDPSAPNTSSASAPSRTRSPEPEPPPKKAAPVLPMRLSSASVAIIKQKEKEPPELAASGEATDEKKPGKGKNMMSPKELEMAAYATGKKVEE